MHGRTIRIATPHPAPPSWGAAATYRACDLCDHGRTVNHARVCTHPEQCPAGLPVSMARAQGGHCGPEAERMHVAWMRP